MGRGLSAVDSLLELPGVELPFRVHPSRPGVSGDLTPQGLKLTASGFGLGLPRGSKVLGASVHEGASKPEVQ